MDALQPYVLPLKGLGNGNHDFQFVIDDDFFAAFPESPIQKAKVDLTVELDKRPNLLVFDFRLKGWIEEQCDRCLAPIQLPIEGMNQLLVKYGDPEDQTEDEDVVYIPFETSSWSLAQFAYEFIVLRIPMIKVYDCDDEQDPPCDLDMLDYLDQEEETEEENTNNPLRDALKNWKQDDN